MSIAIADLNVLQQYISGLMGRADHHAFEVNEIVLAIAGAMVWLGSDIKALERDGEMKNALWFTVKGNKYALSFQHKDIAKGKNEQITLLRKNLQGDPIAIFTNKNSIADVKRVFEAL